MKNSNLYLALALASPAFLLLPLACSNKSTSPSNSPSATPTPSDTVCMNASKTPCTLSPTPTLTNSPTITPTFADTPLPYKAQFSTAPWYPTSLAINSSGTTLFAGLESSSGTHYTVGTFTTGGVSVASYTGGSSAWMVAAGPLNGNAYATEWGYSSPATSTSVAEFTPAGTALTSWNTYGTTTLTGSAGIATAPNGNIYFYDGSSEIYEFTAAGATVTSWGTGGLVGYPCGEIAVSPVSPYNVYVLIYDSGAYSGGFVEEYTSTGSAVTQWGGAGSGYGQFYLPESIAVGPNGNVYVDDTANYLVQEFDGNGNFLSQWASPPHLQTSGGLAAAPNGDVYVCGVTYISVYGP